MLSKGIEALFPDEPIADLNRGLINIIPPGCVICDFKGFCELVTGLNALDGCGEP
jgi:hypothetical protein